MTLITLLPNNIKMLDKDSKIEYTYPAVRGVKISKGQYSYQLNQSLSPNFTYSKPGSFRSGKAKTAYIARANHQFGSGKTHDYELVIEHQTQSGGGFYVVFPIKAGSSSTLNKVVNSSNKVIGETLDLNTDIKNPTNIYNYGFDGMSIFVFDTYINVNNLTNDTTAQYPFTPPSKLTVKFTTGNQKFSDEVVCGEEDVKAKPPPSTDITYIFIMALIGAVFLSISLTGLSWLASSGFSKQIKMISLLISVIILLSAMGGSLVLYLKYEKQLNAFYKTMKHGTVKNTEKTEMYKTIFGSLSIIFAVALLGALFFIYGVVNPKVENAVESGTGTGSGKYASIFK